MIVTLLLASILNAGCARWSWRDRERDPIRVEKLDPPSKTKNWMGRLTSKEMDQPAEDIPSIDRDASRRFQRLKGEMTRRGRSDEAPLESNAGPHILDSNTPEAEEDLEQALATLPPHLQAIFRKQWLSDHRLTSEIDETPPLPSSAVTIGKPTPIQPQTKAPVVANAELDRKQLGTVTASLSDSSEPLIQKSVAVQHASVNPSTSVVQQASSTSIGDAGAVVPAVVAPASSVANPSDAKLDSPAKLLAPVTPSSAISTAVATGPSSLPVTQASSVSNWNQPLSQTIQMLEKELKESPPSDENLRLNMEARLRMLYLADGKTDDSLRPIEGLQEHEREYFRHQMMALHEASNPDAIPVRSRRWAQVMNSQRTATDHLAAVSNLEVKSVAFCTEVEGYGVIKRFPTYQFKPDQDVLLYCELDNVSAEALKDSFETQVQGSYEIIDRNGVRVAEQLLPMEKEICKNRRRDYFIVYRVYMPTQVASGNYQLRLTIEDMKARKYGQATVDIQISK